MYCKHKNTFLLPVFIRCPIPAARYWTLIPDGVFIGDIPLKADPLQLDDSKWGAGKPTAYRTAGSFEASGSPIIRGRPGIPSVSLSILGIKVSGCPSILRRLWVKAALYQWLQGKGALRWFLPVSIDLTAVGVRPGDEVTVAVCADNSDDPSFPGAKQYTMVFVYLVASTVIVILSVPVTCT